MAAAAVHGFESFQFLPEDWTDMVMREGRFRQKGKLPKVPAKVMQCTDWLNESLLVFKQKFKKPITYIHIDASGLSKPLMQFGY